MSSQLRSGWTSCFGYPMAPGSTFGIGLEKAPGSVTASGLGRVSAVGSAIVSVAERLREGGRQHLA
jgi:hypothetical protein